MKKRNRKLRKVLLVACSALILVGISVGATIAYFMDSDTATNTFTVGKVGLTLDEALVDENGKAITGEGADRVTRNEYKLIPGQSYDKDPTVTLTAKSESSYVRMLVTVSDYAELLAICEKHSKDFEGEIVLLQNFVNWDSENWKYHGFTKNADDTATYEFRYKAAVEKLGNADKALEPLFTTLTVPGYWDNGDLLKLEGIQINIEAHAMQAAGFDGNEAKAWSEFSK